MTSNSSPAFQALMEQNDAYARSVLGDDYAVLEIDREDRNLIAEQDVEGGEVPADDLLNDERFDRYFLSIERHNEYWAE